MLLLVAVPAGTSAYFALVSFTGCLIECGTPDPAVGATWATASVLLLALPVVAGLLVARVPLRRAWPWLVGLAAALVLGTVLAQRVV